MINLICLIGKSNGKRIHFRNIKANLRQLFYHSHKIQLYIQEEKLFPEQNNLLVSEHLEMKP